MMSKSTTETKTILLSQSLSHSESDPHSHTSDQLWADFFIASFFICDWYSNHKCRPLRSTARFCWSKQSASAKPKRNHLASCQLVFLSTTIMPCPAGISFSMSPEAAGKFVENLLNFVQCSATVHNICVQSYLRLSPSAKSLLHLKFWPTYWDWKSYW